MLFTFTVLIGTVFPLVVEALRGVQMSVGRPYFDRMAVPLGVALLLLMGVGPALPWGRATPRAGAPGARCRRSSAPRSSSPLGLRRSGVRKPWTLVTLAFGGYTAAGDAARAVAAACAQRMRAHGESLGRALVEVQLRCAAGAASASYVVHAGVVDRDRRDRGQQHDGRRAARRSCSAARRPSVGAYTLTFLGVDQVSEPHREAVVARVGVSRGGRDLGVLQPRMNQYERQREPIGTPAVRTSLFEDLYLSVMNIDPASGSLGLLAMVNPMVGWIWAATGAHGARRPGRRSCPRGADTRP